MYDSFLSEALAQDTAGLDPTLSEEMREAGGLRSIVRGRRAVREEGHQVQGAKLGGGITPRSSLNCSSPHRGGGDSWGEGEGGAVSGPKLHPPPASPSPAGKSLSLSITLLRINFVEIKIGLGINLASRIFSGLRRPQRGQTPIPRSGRRLSFQGRQQPPNPPPSVTLGPSGTGRLVPGGQGRGVGGKAQLGVLPSRTLAVKDSMTVWISGVCPSSFPCQDSALIPATSGDPQGTPLPSGLGHGLGHSLGQPWLPHL